MYITLISHYVIIQINHTLINFQGACHSGFGMVKARFCTIADDDIFSAGTKALEEPVSLSLPPDIIACFLICNTPGVSLLASILSIKQQTVTLTL